MKVLLTGSSGFVGSNLFRYVDTSQIELLPLTREELNSGRFEKLAKVQAIVHLAGKAHDLKNHADPKEYYFVNYELTKKLYSEFLRSDASMFIFISSVKASADKVTNELNENYIPDPKTDYGKSKLLAEQFIQSQVLPEGKSFFILRPCMIHGPGNKGNLNLLYDVISRGLPYPLAAFQNKRSFLSVENLCFVITEILRRTDIPSDVYQVSDNDALSTNELVKLIAESSGRQSTLWKISPRFIRILAKIGDKFHLPITSERIEKLTESYVVSNLKIKNALNKELPMSSREGIRKTFASFRSKSK